MNKKEMREYRMMINWGQKSLIFGVLGSRLFRFLLVLCGSQSDILFGFMDGITVLMLVISIGLGIRGWYVFQKCKVRNSRRHMID